MARKIDVTPDTNLITSIAADKIVWKDALGELIDNALDAGSSHVSISLGEVHRGVTEHIVVSDNGNGTDRMESFVKLGRHVHSHARKKCLGRYGIGFKNAALWIGGTGSVFRVQSTHKNRVYSIVVDWKRLVESEKWELDEDDSVHATATDIGTRVVISPVVRKVPEGKAWDELMEDLGYIYSPAIKQGAQILIKSNVRKSTPVPLKRYELPQLEPGHVDTIIAVNGKQARVYVGIVKEGHQHRRQGITYTYGFRVIERSSSNGCGSYGISRIAGFVEMLGDGWDLTKNKNGINKHASELYDAVFDACKDILARGEAASQMLESASLLSGVEETINRCVRRSPDSKAKRGKGDTHGRIDPTGNGGRHQQAANHQDGATFPRGIRGKLRVEWVDWPEDQGIGKYDIGGSVLLNKSTPVVDKMIKDQNQFGIAMLAMSLIDAAVCLNPCDEMGQFMLRGIEGDGQDRFSKLLGKMLSDATLDGAAIVSSAPRVESKKNCNGRTSLSPQSMSD